ncbi:MAG TPA: DUF3545 family protein [Xanthomonadales bacterium]|nr:DUF3545 family protein [Xanthomonadales bacterium]
MPRAKKKVNSKPDLQRAEKRVQEVARPKIRAAPPATSFAKPNPIKSSERKRGWRDIEAIRERARLKKMLTDIWHEDIELDDDIFGETDHLSGYYANNVEEIEVEIDEVEVEDAEDFEESEE